MTWYLFKDDLHGIQAAAPSRSMAWGLIRNECHSRGVQVPTMDGTYELIGEKVQGNPEKITGHQIKLHGDDDLFMALRMKKSDGSMLYNFFMFKAVLEKEDIEGIVFHHPDGRMCKLRKSDFGIKR